MWRLLEAEMRYDRLRLGLSLILSMVFFIIIWTGVKWERNRVPMGSFRGKHSGATFSRPASGHSGRIHGGRPDSFVIESWVIRHKTILCRFLIERKVIP